MPIFLVLIALDSIIWGEKLTCFGFNFPSGCKTKQVGRRTFSAVQDNVEMRIITTRTRKWFGKVNSRDILTSLLITLVNKVHQHISLRMLFARVAKWLVSALSNTSCFLFLQWKSYIRFSRTCYPMNMIRFFFLIPRIECFFHTRVIFQDRLKKMISEERYVISLVYDIFLYSIENSSVKNTTSDISNILETNNGNILDVNGPKFSLLSLHCFLIAAFRICFTYFAVTWVKTSYALIYFLCTY